MAENLLNRMRDGDLDAARRYAWLADSLGWRCEGFASWASWAEDVIAGNGHRSGAEIQECLL